MIGEIGEYIKGSRVPRKFVCDTEADVADLPKSCNVGSMAVIVETGDVYVVNASCGWVKLGSGG